MKSMRMYVLPPLFIINLTNIVIDIIETFLILRLILKLFGASSGAPFVKWIYETTDSLLWPFRGIFPNSVLKGGFLIEFSNLFAIIIYVLIGYIITEILEVLILRVSQRTIKIE